MGTDCVFLARNNTNLTFKDIESRLSEWPGASGRLVRGPAKGHEAETWEVEKAQTAYVWFQFCSDGEVLVVHDGCRRFSESQAEYRYHALETLRRWTGDDNAALTGDSEWDGEATVEAFLQGGL